MFRNRFGRLSYLFIYFSISHCEKKCTTDPGKCPETKYRSLDGSCNNLLHTDWGMPFSRFRRLLPADYGDGISSYRTTKSGKELPNARKLSQVMYPDVDVPDHNFTLLLMQYGQIVKHDTAMDYTDQNQNFCCTEDLQYWDKPPTSKCSPIDIPEDDPYYSGLGAKCISFARLFNDEDYGCGEKNKPMDQLTMVNSYLDLSVIYGNGKDINSYMRLNKNGLLKIRRDKGQDWPLKSTNVTRDCVLSSIQETCFYASDPRINQNPQLTLLHIIFYREHNRLAKELAIINPHWDDNTLFEEARKINIAQHQWISYYEWLPWLMSKRSLIQHKIIYPSHRTFNDDYDPTVDPGILTEHDNGAFRIHTQIAGHLNLVQEDRSCSHSLRISDWYWHPRIIEDTDHFTLLARGLTTQFSLATDRYHDHEITHFWFRRGKLGYDLKAIDIQRSRDVGVPSYNKIRAVCNLSTAKTFKELTDIPKHLAEKLSKLYETVDDLDMIVGGSLETAIPGALVGPTFHCVLLKQFKRTRIGDRFWFERSGDTGFTLDQLNDIRSKTRLSRLICDNTKDLLTMQEKAFQKIDDTNPLMSCKSLPALNLNLWRK